VSLRRLLLLLAILGVAAAPPVAHAQISRYLGGSGEPLALEDGRGRVMITSRVGAVIGTIERGRIGVVDYPRGAKTEIELSGCETRRRPTPRLRVCIGHDITFSVVKGRWFVRLRGSGINASAVLEGSVSLIGRAGTYEVGEEGEPRRWPRILRSFRLG
jgi:hypothetical protein